MTSENIRFIQRSVFSFVTRGLFSSNNLYMSNTGFGFLLYDDVQIFFAFEVLTFTAFQTVENPAWMNSSYFIVDRYTLT